MALFVARNAYQDSEPARPRRPTRAELAMIKARIDVFVGANKQSVDAINQRILVTEGFARDTGANADDINDIIREMEQDDGTHKTTTGLFRLDVSEFRRTIGDG